MPPPVERQLTPAPEAIDHISDYAELKALIKRSPATGSLISTRFGQIFGEHGESFDPDRCPPIEVVWVQTHRGPQKRIIDGHHRARGIYRHYKMLVEKFPDKQIYKEYDATEASLNNTKIVPIDQRQEGQTALTQSQFLRTSLDPLRQHEENATERAAALLMGLWTDVIEPDPRFPFLFAITTVSNISDYEQQQDKLFAGVPKQKKEAMVKALKNMEVTIKDVDANIDDAIKDSLLFLVTNSDATDAPEAKDTQLAGMLKALSLIGDEKRDKITSISVERLNEIFERLASTHPYSLSVEIYGIYRALADTTLTEKEIDAMLKTRTPSTKYNSLLRERDARERRKERLAQASETTVFPESPQDRLSAQYAQATGKNVSNLSLTESSILTLLANRHDIETIPPAALFALVGGVEKAFQHAHSLLRKEATPYKIKEEIRRLQQVILHPTFIGLTEGLKALNEFLAKQNGQTKTPERPTGNRATRLETIVGELAQITPSMLKDPEVRAKVAAMRAVLAKLEIHMPQE